MTELAKKWKYRPFKGHGESERWDVTVPFFQMVNVLWNHEYTIYFCILNVSTLLKLVHTFCMNSSASESF